MSYNQQAKLQDNIKALELVFQDSAHQPLAEQELDQIRRYAGFGGLKAILYPNGPIEGWVSQGATKQDLSLYPAIMGLHRLIQQYFTPQEYEEVVSSLRNSVLTSFYTPSMVPKVLFEVLKSFDIAPDTFYEPSAGTGVFIEEALAAFPSIKSVNAVEKDILTGGILSTLSASWGADSKVRLMGFEETGMEEDGKYELIVSNIPFGDVSVYDPAYPKPFTSRIHNYFFARGLNKLKDGGLLAYITTDGFLNSPGNEQNRRHLFGQADFISLVVMPENLMKDTGNTMAPSHLLLVQRNTHKLSLSAEEEQLVQSISISSSLGMISLNQYIHEHQEILAGDELGPGKNQYGQPHLKVLQNGSLTQLAPKIKSILIRDMTKNYKVRQKAGTQIQLLKEIAIPGKLLTFLEPPAVQVPASATQIGLFDLHPDGDGNRALDYITEKDELLVQKKSATVLGIIKTAEQSVHESIMIVAARQLKKNYYVYRIYSNLEQISSSSQWMNRDALKSNLDDISAELRNYSHQYIFEGEVVSKLKSLLEPDQHEVKEIPFSLSKPFHKEGILVIHDELTGTLRDVDTEKGLAMFSPLSFQENAAFYAAYIQTRDAYMDLEAYEQQTLSPNDVLRSLANESYDTFVKTYGAFNLPKNKKLLLEDHLFGRSMPSLLERRVGMEFTKSDFLSTGLLAPKVEFSTDNFNDALSRCLNDKGIVDLSFIAQATKSAEQDVIQALGDQIYMNPASGDWETKDKYLSGNVVEKLRQAQQAVALDPDSQQLQRSLTAMEQIQPELIPFELLDFNLGERWIPERYYAEFASSLFEVATKVKYFRAVDSFKVSCESENVKTKQEFAIIPKSGRKTLGHTLFEHALENTSPFYSYEIKNADGSTTRKPDSDAIQLAHQKIENIRNQFITYLRELPQSEKNALETTYNQLFNCYVLREYNGDHQQFPGLDCRSLKIEDLYSSQKNSVWRIVQNRGALIDHEVGLGKTLTMIVASMEMKRLGIANKPMIIALKANVDQIAETYRKAYPLAKILAPGQEDFTPAKRKRIFNEITNNNWDCIILTHDQFGKIPQSPQVMQAIYKDEIHNIKQDLKTLRDMGKDIDKRMLRGMEIKQVNLMNKLRAVTDAIESKKDLGINFIDMGIDHLFVDESHKFKNLTFTTRHERVAGLGNVTGSQKALNMLFAVRTLQQKFDADLCVTFLSGTPISNSLTELYLLFKYLAPGALERQSIENFDGWAAVFARKTSDFEFSVTNEIISKDRYRHFIKLPELALFYNEITDYKTARHIQLDKPELEEILVNISPTPDQIEFTKNLMAFARNGDATLIGRLPLTKEEDKGRMLIATNYAKKMATDMRLIDESYQDHPENKINICVRKVAELYQKSQDYLGTQIIFSDLGTPKPGFNVYDELKQKLVDNFNIPAHEITFIHDWPDKKKPELFEKMNNGQIRILIGSTEKAGTGLNVQERVIALHHMDIPWKPSELEQRFGRGARQGNWAAKAHNGNKVFNFIYATERSLDNYKFNLLRNKLIFIRQMKNSELSVRSIDEGSIDEKSGMNFSEYIAILSGDTTLLEKSKVEKKILTLESLKNAHFKEVYRAKSELDGMKHLKVKTEKLLKELSLDGQLYKGALKLDKDGAKLNPVQFSGLSNADPEQIGNYIMIQSKFWKMELKKEITEKIGSLYGFDLMVDKKAELFYEKGRTAFNYVNLLYARRPGGEIKYNINGGYPNFDHPKLAARYFLNAIDRIDALTSNYSKTLADLNENIPQMETLLTKPFEREAELKDLRASLSRLELEISANIQAKQLEMGVAGFDDLSAAMLSVVPENFSMLLSPEIVQIDSLKRSLIRGLKDENVDKEKRFKQIKIRA